MTDKNLKKQENNKATVSSFVAGAVGAAVVAGAALVTAVVLNDEKTRKNIKEALINVKDQAISHAVEVKENVVDKELEATEKTFKEKNDLQN